MNLRLSSKLSKTLINWRVSFIASAQGALIIGSLTLSWLLLFDFTLPQRHLLLASAGLLVVIRLATLRLFNLHHGWWHYTGIADTIDIIKAVILGSALFFLTTTIWHPLESFPKPIFVLEPLLTMGLLAGVRLLSRVTAESVRNDMATSKRVLVIGAGFAAQQIIREMSRPESGYAIVGCLDDDTSKRGIRIHGVSVLGTVNALPSVVTEYYVEEVLIAVPSATGTQMERFVDICSHANVKFRTVPALREIISGHVGLSQLREVSLEDLLGREPARIDLESVRKLIAGRRVAVTGAAGSIGSELCRQILDYGPDSLVCLDQSETGLFFLEGSLSVNKNGSQLPICVADIGDSERMRRLFQDYKPEIVFHAAAYKHVPLMERNVQEAVRNNVFVFQNLLDIAQNAGCKNFVLISSDKAVNPTSVMGATKRICELIASSRPPNGMRCVTVRFGNVLGSSGSVIPVFQQQLKDNQPITVTHPEMKRFFMMTREAVALVLQAFAIGYHGDILVLDMGDPIAIMDLARNLIRLSGKSEQTAIFKFTGLREGEKLQEELFYQSETAQPTSCTKIKKVTGRTGNWQLLQRHLHELKLAINVDGAKAIRVKIKEIVPEFSFASGERDTETKDSSTAGSLSQVAGFH